MLYGNYSKRMMTYILISGSILCAWAMLSLMGAERVRLEREAEQEIKRRKKQKALEAIESPAEPTVVGEAGSIARKPSPRK